MSFRLFCFFLILLQNSLTEQVTEGTIQSTTDYSSTYSENTESISSTERTSDSTIYESNTYSSNTENSPSTTEESTENSNTNSRNTQTFSSTEPISEGTTEDTNTNSTVSNKSIPLIKPRALPSDDSKKSENGKLNEQKYRSYEKNFSTASVFGIVLGSIVGTVAVFYIILSLLRNYKRKSYVVRSPSMELGQT